MKKLCFIINSDWYFELHWIERALAAKKAGYEVYVVCHFNGEGIKSRLESYGFKCHDSHIAAQSYNPFNFMISFFKIWKILNHLNPAVIHCVTIKSFLIGGLFAKLKSKAAVLSFAGLGRIFDNRKLAGKVLRFIVVMLYRFIASNKKSVLLFEHEADREKLVNLAHINEARTLVIDGAGINTDDYPYVAESNVDIPIVLFASRMLWSKGLAELVKVKKALAKSNVHFQLNVAGILCPDDTDSIPLTQLEQWNREGAINWIGRSNKVSELIERANIIALPSSYSEGVPRILLEAASMGRATLAYDVGGCKSIVQDGRTGFLVEKNQISKLEHKLKTLLLDANLRREMGLAGRNLVLSKFSSSMVISKTLEIYSNITNR